MAQRRASVGGDDEVDLLLDVVEGEHLVEEHEVRVGDVEFVLRGRWEVLDLADDVVGEEADGAGGEGREAGEARGSVAGERRLQLGEDVAGRSCGACAALVHGDGAAARGHRACRARMPMKV